MCQILMEPFLFSRRPIENKIILRWCNIFVNDKTKNSSIKMIIKDIADDGSVILWCKGNFKCKQSLKSKIVD